MKSKTKVLGVISALAIMLAGIAVIVYDPIDDINASANIYTGGPNTSTAGNPYDGIDVTADLLSPAYPYYVNIGGTVSIEIYEDSDFYCGVQSYTSGFGLAYSGNVLSGILSKVGTLMLIMEDSEPAHGPYNVTIHVVDVPKTIPYNAPTNLTPIVGANWYYTPTTTDGVTISIQGAPWLSTAGNAIYGTPTTPGTYNVTVTMTKTGYVTSTNTFTLVVSSELIPTNSPTNGMIIYSV